MSATRIRLHLGVHKTGTTYLQRLMDGCSFTEGTVFLNETLSRQMIRSQRHAAVADNAWLSRFDGTLIISDENLLGEPQDAFRLYPVLPDRLNILADMGPDIFVCLRTYADLFTSAYTEMLKWNRYFDFPLWSGNLERRWPDFVSNLKTGFPGSRITLWDYADFKGNEQAAARLISGDTIISFGPSPTRLAANRRPSARAVEEMKLLSTAPTQPQRRAIRLGYPAGKAYPRYNPWSNEAAARLTQAYTEDWEKLRELADVWVP